MARGTKSNSKRRNLAASQQKRTVVSQDFLQSTKGSYGGEEEGEPCCSAAPVFPQWTCLVVCVITMTVRVHITTRDDWILHPDEVFQSTEVAFSEVYGYGFRSYEFGPVPEGNDTLRLAVEAERGAGMYAMRSFVYPRFLAMVMMAAERARLQIGPFQAARISHAIVSSLLPYAAYRLTRKLYGCDDVANMASILVALSDHLIILGAHTLINSFLSPFLFLGISGIISPKNDTSRKHLQGGPGYTDSSKAGSDSNVKLVWGIVIGLVCYIRVDASMSVAVIIMSTVLPVQTSLLLVLEQFLRPGMGMLLGFILGALDDYLCYGYWFISPIQWARFNLVNDYATLIFGKEDAMFYVRHLLGDSLYLSLVTASSVSVVVCAVLTSTQVRLPKVLCPGRILPSVPRVKLIPGPHLGNNTEKLVKPATPVLVGTSLRLASTLTILFCLYIFKGHKEVRFIHNWIVLLLVFCSSCLVKSLQSVLRSGILIRYVLYFLVGVLTMVTYVTFPSQDDGSVNKWAFGHHGDSGHVNRALSFIGQQPDTTGVFLDYPVYMTGGYSVLCRDVPIIGKVQHEYREWSLKERRRLPTTFSSVTLGGKAEVSVASFSRVAFLASEKNWLLLIRRLIDYPVYNYAIVPEGKTFLRTGFDTVKTFGTVMVLRRNTSAEENAVLQTLRKKIPIGPNAAVLESEAQTLLTLGNVNMAIERLRAAIDLEPTRTRAQRLLQSLFTAAKNENSTEPSKFKY